MPHAHVLSGSLISSGSMNADKLSLDLQFSADRSLTARKGPTPSFSRASAASYIGSDGLIKSSAINEPRFDFDPSTLICNGLLIEETRTNLLFPSDTLTTQTRTVTATAHTLSFYGTGTIALSGVSIATVTGTGAYPTKTTLTFTPTAGSLILTVTGSVVFAQLEAGAFPTSYIPTTTTSLTRSADVCSISSISSFYNSTESTFFAEILVASASNYNSIIVFDNGVSNEQIGITAFPSPNTLNNYVVSGSSTQAATALSFTTNTFIKVASSSKLNSFQLSLNGYIGTKDTYGIMPTVDRMNIGSSWNGNKINGYIKSIKIYQKAMTDAKLQILTT